MTWVLRLLWFLFGDEAKRKVVNSAKRKGVLAYLKALQVGRRAFLVAVLCIMFLQLTVFAGVGALITGILLWDADFQFKMEVLFWICIGALVVPGVLIGILLSERLWYRFSGAEKMLQDL